MKLRCFNSVSHVLRAYVGAMRFLVLLVSTLSCTECESPGPLLRLHIGQVDPATIQAVLTVLVNDPSGTPREFSQRFPSGPFDDLGAQFPKGMRGAVHVRVSLYGPDDCILASGSDELQIDSDEVIDKELLLTPIAKCGNGVTLTLLVANIGQGMGTVTSTPSGIDCDGKGSGCSIVLTKGTQLSLRAQTIAGTFSGWLGGRCTGTSPCTLTVDQDTVIHASFSSCHGWCKESPPSTGATPNLLGIGGTAPSNVLASGEDSTIYHFDGAMWKPIALPAELTSRALRAVAGKLNGAVTYVAGDSGTILTWRNGSMTQVAGIADMRLRAIALGDSPALQAAVVGEAGAAVILSGSGAARTDRIGSADLFAICRRPATSPISFLVGGIIPLSSNRTFAVEWDGRSVLTAQLTSQSIDPSGVHSMACGGARLHIAATANGTLLENVVTGDGTAPLEDRWKVVSAPTEGKIIRSLWSYGDSFAIAVGEDGMILRYDGSTWTKMTSNVTSDLQAVWGTSPLNIYAVGDNATVLHYSP